MDIKVLLSIIFLILGVSANFAVGRISARPSAGKRSLRSSAKFRIVRNAFDDESICSLNNLVEIREQMDLLSGQLQELRGQYDECIQGM